MDEIIIRRITAAEIVRLQDISRQTFIETFAGQNSPGDMERYLSESLSIEKLTAELSNPGSEFYFALLGSTVVGYLKINRGQAQTELWDPSATEIERIYVLSDFQGKKVGRLLYDKALDIARQATSEYLWLGVWEKNLKAISFYRKIGFVEFDKHVFRLGNDEQTDLMMRLKI